MKKILALAGLLALSCAGVEAQAGFTPTYEVGYSTFATVALHCTTGTAIQVNGTRPSGFTDNVAGYRIQNHNATSKTYFGGVFVAIPGATVTNGAASGEYLAAGGGSGTWHLGKNPQLSGQPITPLYCICESAAGANSCVITVTWFGY